jgi:ubiquitin-activating enzyme E1
MYHVFTDFAKMENPNTIHIGVQALHAFAEQRNGALPAPWNADDAALFIK